MTLYKIYPIVNINLIYNKECIMGLDQFMNCVSGNGKEYYWRKHARLQQFMSQKWAEQNPNSLNIEPI